MNQITVLPRAMKKRDFYCCSCGEKLIPHPRTRILSKDDPEYKKHRSLGRGKRLVGNIELTEYDFKCMSCNKLTPYDEQCVIEEIQKQVGSRILSEDNISENSEKAKNTLEQKKKTRSIITKVLSISIAVLVLCCWLKSGNFSFEFHF